MIQLKLGGGKFDATLFFKRYGTPLFALGLFVVFSFLSENFLSLANFMTVLKQMAALVVMALGFTFALSSGTWDMSLGNTIGLVNMLWCYVLFATNNFYLSILTAMVVGAAVGAINGYIVSYVGLPGFIITYAMGIIMYGIKMLITGGTPISFPDDVNAAILFIGRGKIGGWLPCSVVIMLFLVCLVHFLQKKTRLGRRIYAIGSNPTAARYSGINNKFYGFMSLTLSGLFMGIASVLATTRLASAQPLGGADMQMDVIAAGFLSTTMFGEGEPTGLGTFVGAFIITMLINGMTMLRFEYYYQYITKGLVVVLAILVSVLQDNKLKKGQ